MHRRITAALFGTFLVGAVASPSPTFAAPPASVDATAAAAAADDGEACAGTLEVDGKTYKLGYAVAYAVKVFDEPGVAVLFSEAAIPVGKLRAALAEGEGSDDKFFHFKPHVRVTFG